MHVQLNSQQAKLLKNLNVPMLQQAPETKEEVLQPDEPTISSQIKEMQAALPQVNDSELKTKQMIEKFNSGKKLTRDELNYLIKHAPGEVDRILRITAEREMHEQAMRAARTKQEVQHVVQFAIKGIQQTKLSMEDAKVRSAHVNDALMQYQKTDEYKDKPNLMTDHNKPNKKHRKNQPEQSHVAWAAAQLAYEKGQIALKQVSQLVQK